MEVPMLSPLPLPQQNCHMPPITLAFPLPSEALGAAPPKKAQKPPVSVLTAHVQSDPGTQRTDSQLWIGGELILAHFLQREASGQMTLTKVEWRERSEHRERSSSMEEGEVSRGEAERREGENKTKGQKPRPASSWPRPLTATAQQGGVHLQPLHAQVAHLSRSQNAPERQCSLTTLALRPFRYTQPHSTSSPPGTDVHSKPLFALWHSSSNPSCLTP